MMVRQVLWWGEGDIEDKVPVYWFLADADIGLCSLPSVQLKTDQQPRIKEKGIKALFV